MTEPHPKVVTILKTEIESRLKDLLETKHLYQSVRIDTSAIQVFLDGAKDSPEVKQMCHRTGGPPISPGLHIPPPSLEDCVGRFRGKIIQTRNDILDSIWGFASENELHKMRALSSGPCSPTLFELKTISVPCSQCAAINPPHNPGITANNYPHKTFDPISWIIIRGVHHIQCQTFIFPYHCQSCKKEPLVFMVRREGLKLTLVGRNHFENPQVPSTLPREEANFFGEAVMAFNTGSVLAGLFMLRTTVEQYMRRILNTREKLTGDDLADRYAQRLADDFPKERYPSLKTVYDELSACLHAADANEMQFVKARADIEKHFALLEHFPLKCSGV